MGLKVVIVGGVAGGASAAARLRRVDEKAEIVLFEKGEYISFANCGLPYYIGGVISEKEKLLVQTPQGMGKRFHIDIRVKTQVTKINIESKTVTVKEVLTGKTYEESYDKLILSPGAEPVRPPIPGIDNAKIFTLRNIPDTYKIKDYIDRYQPKSAVIVGAGFIGLEMAENLHLLGIKTAVVELSSHVIGALDFDMAAIVHQHLKAKGIDLYLENGVNAFEDDGKVLSVKLNKGDTIATDMVIMGVGVRPETKLAAEAGLAIGNKCRPPTKISMPWATQWRLPISSAAQRLSSPLQGPPTSRAELLPTTFPDVLTASKAHRGPLSSRCLI